MKELTLDYNTWRCGDDSEDEENKVGNGKTLLLNEKGFMCCLGQFALQVGMSKEQILDKGEPSEIDGIMFDDENILSDDEFTSAAIDINDNEETTVIKKAESLKILCADKGIELKCINFPKNFPTNE